MSDDICEACPECSGEGTVIHPGLQAPYQGSHAESPPDPVRVPCEKCDGSGEITEDDHDAFGCPYGTLVNYRGEKRVVFYEHEGDHVLIWWFPGEASTHGPADATEAEKNEIYARLWAEMEDRWASSPEDDRTS